MLLFTSLLLLIFSSTADAFPQIGNYARYQAHHEGRVYELKRSLIDFNPSSNSFLQASQLSVDGRIISENTTHLSAMWFYTPVKIENVLKNCFRRSGVIELIRLGAEHFEACTFYHEDAQLDYSLGMVPFGQLRFQQYLGEGRYLDFYLIDFID